MWRVVVLAVVFAVCAGTGHASPFRVDTASNLFIDDQGRHVIFRGLNFVEKGNDWIPHALEDPSLVRDLADMLGFNGLRVGTMFGGGMPVRGQVNQTYITAIENIVNLAGKAGLYSLLDSHQDVYSHAICGEGFPPWSVTVPNDTLPFPLPVSFKEIPMNKSTGKFESCPKVGYWGDNYFTAYSGATFQSLYDNTNGLRDMYAKFWTALAARFKANPYIIGYELINEPWMGDHIRHPSLFVPGHADKTNLQPFYRALHNEIRTVDNDTMLFFEPVTWDYLPVGFTEGPGGPDYSSKQALSYHIYCLGFSNNKMTPLKWLECNGTALDMFDQRLKDQQRLNVGGMMTEWGGFGALSNMEEVHYMERWADERLQSWLYWACDPISGSPCNPNNKGYNQDLMRNLSRPYAQATAGTPTAMDFNVESYTFTFEFKQDTGVTAPTVIFASQLFHYPNGVDITVWPMGALEQVKQTRKNFFEFVAGKEAKQNQPVTITLKRK